VCKKIVWLLVFSFLFCALLAGCTREPSPSLREEFPGLRVYSGENAIEWVYKTDSLEAPESGSDDSLTQLIKTQTPGSLIYLKNGETITIEFEGEAPSRATLTELIRTADGSAKYGEGMNEPVALTLENGKLSFTIKENYATALSSDSADYVPGAVIKGYHLVCTWDRGVCEYYFAIRGDAAFLMNPPEAFKVRELLDYYYDDDLPWESTLTLDIPEFEGVNFQWTSEAVTANGKSLFEGMPVWNVYLSDLNGDALPEICATVSMGSGIVDNRILAYDYLNKKSYELEARTVFDYALSLKDDRLIVTQTAYGEGPPGSGSALGTGHLAIVGDQLVFAPLDQTDAE